MSGTSLDGATELQPTEISGNRMGLHQRKPAHATQEATVLSTTPSMKGWTFSPFVDPKKVPRLERVGVPGYGQYPQFWKVMFLWKGTSLEAIMKCNCTHAYMLIQTSIFLVFAFSGYPAGLRGAAIPTEMFSTFRTLTVFILTFFISQMLGKCNTRFENVCKTNGYVTRLTALAAALYPRPEAETLMRYTNGIMNIYYLLMSGGGMTDEKWKLLVSRGILTEEEVKGLQQQGSPGVVLYCWALGILKCGPAKSGEGAATSEMASSLTQVNNMWSNGMLPLQLNMDDCIGGTRGLAAKQIAYTLQQPSLIYFHAVYVVTHVFLLVTAWNAGHMLGEAVTSTCEELFPSDDESNGDQKGGACVPRCIMVVLVQHVLVFTFLVLLKSAEHLSEAYGFKAYHYDLGVDLDNLWQESINVLQSMDGAPRPPLVSMALGKGTVAAELPAPPLPGCDC